MEWSGLGGEFHLFFFSSKVKYLMLTCENSECAILVALCESSLASDRSLLQAFVPELEQLRVKMMEITASASAPVAVGLQAEVLATFPSTCGSKGSKCTVSLLGDSATSMTTITLWADKGQ